MSNLFGHWNLKIWIFLEFDISEYFNTWDSISKELPFK